MRLPEDVAGPNAVVTGSHNPPALFGVWYVPPGTVRRDPGR